MLLDLVVLGANSALPVFNRFSSSFVLRSTNRNILIDAGEGCQLKLGEFKIRRSKLSHIFISHLHGDHIFGLPGLLTSFNLNGRKEPLTLFGPSGLKEYVEVVLRVSGSFQGFPLHINEISNPCSHHLTTIDNMDVQAFPLRHRISTYGYMFKENEPKRNIRREKLEEFQFTIEEIKTIKRGGDINRHGEVIANEELTYIKHPLRSFAYCSDTAYEPSIVEYIKGVDLLYHEATYLHALKNQAEERMHTTAHDAALIAKSAQVKKLLIGHYSSRYKDLNPLLEEAQSIFENTDLAVEGKEVKIN